MKVTPKLGVASVAERDQVIGRADSRTFEYYLIHSVKYHIQAAVLVSPSENTL